MCLNVGCIPSKALLKAAELIDEANEAAEHGIDFGKPKVDRKKLVTHKNNTIKQLNQGLAGMAKQRNVNVVTGYGEFASANSVTVKGDKATTTVNFKYAIIAAGSEPVSLPFIPEDERIFNSTGALNLAKIDGKLLVMGGGIIGLEMATVYNALGAEVHIVELQDQLMPGADKDMVAPLHKRIEKRYGSIMLETKVTKVEATQQGIKVTFEGKHAPEKPQVYDQMLVSVGRTPNGKKLNAQAAGFAVDERGFIQVDKQLRTTVPHIYAIGDIIGQPMLAHKATAEGRLAVEIIDDVVKKGQSKKIFEPRCIPSVAYTDPEIAWVGETEQALKDKKVAYGKGVFPWMASGRAIGTGRTEGMTKLLFDEKTHRVLGAGIVGVHAGDLICEMALAMEMDCDAEDIASTIHPHPTFGETIGLAAEVYEGTATDLPAAKKA